MYLKTELRIFSILKTRKVLVTLMLLGVIPVGGIQIAFSHVPQQRQVLTCDNPGFPSCYSTGYNAGLLTRGSFSSCTGTINSLGSLTQVNNYCSGFSAAQQQQQQQHVGLINK